MSAKAPASWRMPYKIDVKMCSQVVPMVQCMCIASFTVSSPQAIPSCKPTVAVLTKTLDHQRKQPLLLPHAQSLLYMDFFGPFLAKPVVQQ